jgi:hypothetical protein
MCDSSHDAMSARPRESGAPAATWACQREERAMSDKENSANTITEESAAAP